MQNLEQLYLEHEKIITDNLPEIKHVDLWAEQVSFLAEEHPFKSPAVFFSYRSNAMEDISLKEQRVHLQVDVYYFFETFADTARGSKKQTKALDFLKLLSKINSFFHGTSGVNFEEMRRIGFTPVETGTANLLYLQRYECILLDQGAMVESEHVLVNDVDVIDAKIVPVDQDSTVDVDVE